MEDTSEAATRARARRGESIILIWECVRVCAGSSRTAYSSRRRRRAGRRRAPSAWWARPACRWWPSRAPCRACRARPPSPRSITWSSVYLRARARAKARAALSVPYTALNKHTAARNQRRDENNLLRATCSRWAPCSSWLSIAMLASQIWLFEQIFWLFNESRKLPNIWLFGWLIRAKNTIFYLFEHLDFSTKVK